MDNNSTLTTSYAGLATLAEWMQRKGIWRSVADKVIIKQKKVKHQPIDKLLDIFIHILTGESRLVTMNTGLRCDEGLQRAFGRETCVEQSLASTTLDRCDEETVVQMKEAVKQLIQKHSRCCRHNYKRQWQVLDLDMTGLLAGKQAEGSETGYFANKRGARGRQLGRVLASNYDEIVYEKLYPGRAHLETKLEELLSGAADVLQLDEQQIQRTLLRIDGAGGSDRFINNVLTAGYGILTKVHNWKRSAKLADSVQEWHQDAREAGREVGWVTALHPYARPTSQLAIRKRNKRGTWNYNILVTNLPFNSLRWLAQQPTPRTLPKTNQTMWAVLYAYDRRGGGVETSIRESKQALAVNKRNKRRFPAQEMLVLLAQLAHNLLIWFRRALEKTNAKWRTFGLMRLIRDALKMRGAISFHINGPIAGIFLHPSHLNALHWMHSAQELFPSNELSFCLYEN